VDPSLAQLERYRVIEEVGRGGMAVVYRAHDRSLDREVALKVLHAHLAGADESRLRFQREAKAVARLRHRNIIEIYDFAALERDRGPSYIVTEFIEGPTLKAFMEQHRAFFPEVAALIGIEICAAIGHAHELGIIHRDLKPENMMITAAGRLKLMDFGIAKVIDQQQQMTITGTILGSPAHMAPEMLEGRPLDVRSDLFSVGTILYWLATGRLPFTGQNPHQVLRRILEGDYPDPQQANPEVGAELARIIKRCLALQPEQRFASAAELQRALENVVAGLELDDAPDELARFFARPEQTLSALRPRVAGALLERGRRQLQAKQHRPALEALDRLLAMEPGQPDALALINGIERRKRWLRRGAWTAAALGLAGLLGLGLWAALALWPAAPDRAADGDRLDAGLAAAGGPIPGPLPEGPGDGGPAAPAGGDRAAAEAGGLDGGTAPAAGADPTPAGDAVGLAAADRKHKPDRRRRVAIRPLRGQRPKPERQPPAAVEATPEQHPVTIRSNPYFEQLLIDGRLVAEADASNRYGFVYRGELPAGEHRVLLRNRACVEEEKKLVVPAEPRSGAELNFGYKLQYKPALLVVDSALPEAAVFVDGDFKGTAGESRQEPILVPIPGGQRTGRLKVELRLSHPQAGEVRRQVLLKAGQQVRQTVERAAFDPAAARDGGRP
jgi:serine/threonine-protein kinase